MLGSIAVTIMAILFVLVCLFMIMVILVQKPRGGGLVGAFGGQGAAQQAFGSKVGDLLTWFTVGCFTAFLLLAIMLTWYTRMDTQVYNPQTSVSAPITIPAPPAAATPDPAPTTPTPENPAPVPATPATEMPVTTPQP
ncbi:MAG: preprotein translocase subunit SecG [Phycisphaerales bacterium]|nr:preprotein translocase subunit SecG [Phycisphaerales bacterium]